MMPDDPTPSDPAQPPDADELEERSVIDADDSPVLEEMVASAQDTWDRFLDGLTDPKV